MVNYAKTVLYAYPKLKAVMKVIDGKFSASMVKGRYDVVLAKDCLDELIRLTEIKSVLVDCYNLVTKVLSELTEDEYDLIAYKYLGKKYKGYVEYDSTDRGYYRKQQKIIGKIREKLVKVGITEEWFNQKLLCFPFIKELHRRTNKNERAHYHDQDLKKAQ